MSPTTIFWSVVIVCYFILLTVGLYVDKKIRQHKPDDTLKTAPDISGLIMVLFLALCAISGLILHCFHIIG